MARNLYTLAVLTPGVVGYPCCANDSYAQFGGDIFQPEYHAVISANGQDKGSNSFLVDDANVNSSSGLARVNVVPNADSVAEVRVSLNNFSAESGRHSSARISVITKSGTNDYHGTAGWYHTNHAQGDLAANYGCDFNADGIPNDRPNQPAYGNSLSGVSNRDYIDGIFQPSDFPAPPLGQLGNLGRNTFTGPGLASMDFSVFKNTRIPWLWGSEGANLQFRTEIFNFFNRVNFAGVDADLASPWFGRAYMAYGARNVQFGIRIVF